MAATQIDRARVRQLSEHENARFRAERPKSMALLEQGRASMPHGVPMGWMDTLYDHPPVVVAAGEGAWFTDVDGHRYLDTNLADNSAFCGYAPQPVTTAIARQAALGTQFLLPTEDARLVAEMLAARFGLPRWQFTLSASSANTEAVRLARAATGRDHILVFDGKYLGHADEQLAVLDGHRVVPQYLGLPANVGANVRMVQFNDLDAIELALADGGVACVLTEAAQTDLGVIQPEPGFHARLRELTRAAGTLLVIDETHTLICGLGGLTRAWELDPDIVTMGKSIGGVPVGAYGVREELAALLESAGGSGDVDLAGETLPEVAVGGTLYGNALSMAATRAALAEVLTQEAYERAVGLGVRMAAGIAAAIAAADLPWSTQRLYTRSGYTFAPELPRNAIEARAAMDFELGTLVRISMVNRGVWEAGYWSGPAVSMAATDADVDFYVTVFGEVLETLS